MNSNNQTVSGQEFIINEYNDLKIVEQKTKVCPRCKREKPTNLFYKNRKGQYSSYCKSCHMAYGMRINYNKRKECKRDYIKNNNKDNKIIIIEHYSDGKNCCACCGESHIEFLTLDHINGGGSKQKRDLGISGSNTQKFYKWLINNNFPNDPHLQVLCFNCNITKGIYGYCPHKTKVTEEPIPIN